MANKKATTTKKAATGKKEVETKVTKKALAKSVTQRGLNLTPAQVELVKRTVAKDATDDELGLFLYQAKRTGLDPLTRQIHFVKRGGQATIQTGIDGFRVVAERSGSYAGQDKPEYQYSKTANRLQNGKAYPAVAIITVYRFNPKTGERYPAGVGEARWSEYLPTGNQGFMWQKMPHTMLSKCAEAVALRKAFPQDLSGIYTFEEMQQAGEPVSGDLSPAKSTQATTIASQPQKAKIDYASRPSLRKLFALGTQAGFDSEKLKAMIYTAFKVKSITELSQAQVDKAIKGLQQRIEQSIINEPRVVPVQEAEVVDEQEFVNNDPAVEIN